MTVRTQGFSAYLLVDSKIQVSEFGVQYLAQAQVMRPAIFVSEASVFQGLVSETKILSKH